MTRAIKLGTTASGDRVTVEIAVHPLDRAMQSVTHETVTSGLRLSISGNVYEGRRRDPISAGQCYDAVREIVTPYRAWALSELAELADVWDRWHLNDMRAGCAHQGEPTMETSQGYPRVDLASVAPCPVTGYRYGHAWLYEPLPDVVVARVRQWQIRTGY